jgi:ankyrin repeat protein
VNAVNSRGESVLCNARKEYIVRVLLKAKADPNRTDKNGNTPLIRATVSKQPNRVLLLIENKANIDQVNNHGYTALMHACYYQEVDMVRSLLDAGADVTIRNNIGKAAVNYALRELRLMIVNKIENRK